MGGGASEGAGSQHGACRPHWRQRPIVLAGCHGIIGLMPTRLMNFFVEKNVSRHKGGRRAGTIGRPN